jgi:D-serine deaminase-like pyridoxal phosphate-dependent protein
VTEEVTNVDIETPALVVDLDRLQANVDRMSALVKSRGLDLRPHAKTHKCLEIAEMQRQAGAVGLTVATLSEAEVFADAGFTDLLVAYPVFPSGTKGERLRRLLDKRTSTSVLTTLRVQRRSRRQPGVGPSRSCWRWTAVSTAQGSPHQTSYGSASTALLSASR